MYAAGRGMQMDTIIVGPVKLEVDSKSYCTDVYVALDKSTSICPGILTTE
jgi:hypothetical protein